MRQLEGRHGKRLLGRCGAIAAVGVLLNGASCATCSCRPSGPDEAYRSASVVFAGRVARIHDPRWWKSISTGSDPLDVTFDVERVWKGDVAATITVQTARSGASCGYDFERRERYLVYAREGRVSLCSRTRTVMQAEEDLRVLGDGHVPAVGRD